MRDRTLAMLFRRSSRKGDGRALAAVFDATAKELLDLACHLVRDPSEAEDLVQATFLTAIQKGASYDGSAPLQAWLYGILWREAAKARRRAARAVDPRRLAERSVDDPHAVSEGRELPSAVGEALARLPGRYREVLQPFLFEERRPDGIARALGRSPGTVRSQIHRGLEELRRALAPRFAAWGVVALPTRGLASVRAEVLRAAGFPPLTAATAPAAALGLTLGGVLMSKAVLVGTAAVAAVITGAWVAVARTGREGAAAGSAVVERGLASARRAGTEIGREAEPPLQREVEREARPAAEPQVRSSEERIAYWLARFAERPDGWRHGWNVTKEIAALPPDEALAVMTAVWPHLSVPVKEQALKPFVFDGGHVHALEVLHLAATDAALSVQGRAFEYLKDYAFRDFALDYEAYLGWAAANRDRPVAEVLTENARAFVAEMLACSPAERAERMLGLHELDLRPGGPAGVDLAAVLREAGGLRLLEAALADANEEVRELALRWSRTLQADERWLRAFALPAIEAESAAPGLAAAAFGALAREDCTWAQPILLEYLERATRVEPHGASFASSALVEHGDLTVVPRLIGILLRDQTGKLAYDVGYFGLAKLTGVTWQEGYDAQWWLDWWEKNRRRFPPEVAALDVPR